MMPLRLQDEDGNFLILAIDDAEIPPIISTHAPDGGAAGVMISRSDAHALSVWLNVWLYRGGQ